MAAVRVAPFAGALHFWWEAVGERDASRAKPVCPQQHFSQPSIPAGRCSPWRCRGDLEERIKGACRRLTSYDPVECAPSDHLFILIENDSLPRRGRALGLCEA